MEKKRKYRGNGKNWGKFVDTSEKLPGKLSKYIDEPEGEWN